MIQKKLLETLESEGYKGMKEIEERGICALYRFLFTVALVYDIDEFGYKGRYCYSSLMDATIALNEWDGKDDPPGNWIKHKGYTEFCNPNYKSINT